MEKLNSQKLHRLKSQLEQLGCPYLENASDQNLEFLFTPSEQRLRLISWAVVTFDSKLEGILDECLPMIGGPDARYKKALFALNIMGVCKIDNLELIRGTAGMKSQFTFFCNLIDLLYTSQMGHPYREHDPTDTNSSYFLNPVSISSVDERFTDSCRFVDSLVRHHKMKDLFSTNINLFSPEYDVAVKEELKQMGSVPPLKALEETTAKMKADLDELVAEVDDIVLDLTKSVAPDQNIVENYCRKLELSLKTFAQMIDNFLYCYDSDIKSWCMKKDPLDLMNFGSQVKIVSNMASKPIELMKSISSYNTAMSYFSDDMKGEMNQLSRIGEVNTSAQETCNILQNSMFRIQDQRSE